MGKLFDCISQVYVFGRRMPNAKGEEWNFKEIKLSSQIGDSFCGWNRFCKRGEQAVKTKNIEPDGA